MWRSEVRRLKPSLKTAQHPQEQKARQELLEEFKNLNKEVVRLDQEIANAPLRSGDFDSYCVYESRITDITEGPYGGAGGKDSTESDRIEHPVLFGKRKNRSISLLQSKTTLLQQVRCLKDLVPMG